MEQALTETPHVKYPLIDGHSHIDQFESQVIDQIIERATEVNVGLIISAGTTMESCRRVIQLAENYPIIRGGIGLHPADLIDWISEKEIAAREQDTSVGSHWVSVVLVKDEEKKINSLNQGLFRRS